MNTAIDVKQLSVTLGNRHILHDINVSVPIGKITTLIGPNGCGKSTLLRSMIGYIHSPHECITIFDKPLQSYSQNHLARQMAFLPQVPNMPKDMTVEELVLKVRSKAKASRPAIAIQLKLAGYISDQQLRD